MVPTAWLFPCTSRVVPTTWLFPCTRRAWLLSVALLQTGCVVVPRTVSTYDHVCRVYARQVTLEAVPMGGIVLNCSTGAPANCTAGLVVAGVVSSASAVVSGSIAIVGNIVYWVERQGQCATAPPAPAPI